LVVRLIVDGPVVRRGDVLKRLSRLLLARLATATDLLAARLFVTVMLPQIRNQAPAEFTIV